MGAKISILRRQGPSIINLDQMAQDFAHGILRDRLAWSNVVGANDGANVGANVSFDTHYIIMIFITSQLYK